MGMTVSIVFCGLGSSSSIGFSTLSTSLDEDGFEDRVGEVVGDFVGSFVGLSEMDGSNEGDAVGCCEMDG